MRGFVDDHAAPGGVRLADDLPEPEPAPDELVLDVRAYAVNRGELHSLERNADGWRPGQDVAGVVAAAADGSGPAVGTRVAAAVYRGGWAERVAVRAAWTAPLPDHVSFEDASTLWVAGTTALRALQVDGPVLGRRVLVTGATGGVGQFALQLARAGGAHVTALVSAPEREQEARELGAHAVATTLEDDAVGRFDLVLDGVGGAVLTQALRRLAPGGTVATYGTVGGRAEVGLQDFGAHGPYGKLVGVFHYWPEETIGDALAELVRLVGEGAVRPRIGLVRDWLETPAALDALRRREVRGKAVLTRSAR